MPTSRTTPSLDTLLAAFDAARGSTRRTLAAMALVRTGLRDDRILAALARLLDENPVGAAFCLGRLGDARAIPDLVRSFDSNELVAKTDCAICAAEILDHLAHTIERLGGALTPAQRARLQRIDEQADRLWVTVRDPLASGPSRGEPAGGGRGPGRNTPCRCGSGKKYKRCCGLERDGARRLH